MPTLDTLATLVLNRLQTAPLPVYDGEVPDTPPGPYAVVYPGAGVPSSSRLCNTVEDFHWQTTIVCAGSTPEQARFTVQQVRARVTGWDPQASDNEWLQPTNRSSGPLSETGFDSPPLIPDRSVPNDLRYSYTLIFHMYTNRS